LFSAKRLEGKVAGDGEDGRDDEEAVDGIGRWLGPANLGVADFSDLVTNCVEQGEWQQQGSEGIEMEGFAQMTAQDCGESAGGAAAGA